MAMRSTVAAAALGLASGTVFMKESFDKDWDSRWTVGSDWKPKDETGVWKHTAGEYPGEGFASDKGIQTSEDARFYSLTAPLSSNIVNDKKDLILSYTVKHEQNLDCGGAYIKLVNPGFDAKKFGGDTPYSIMFGPDVCGTTTRKTHVIFTYGGKNHLVKKNVKVETDRLSHRYTLTVRTNNTYEVDIDGVRAETGSLYEDFDMLPPATILDPSDKKPSTWVDEPEMDDPEDVKPAGYDDIPAKIADPEAKKPEDWDDAEDGEWETPQIDNPEYKGPFRAKKIKNPAYTGPWIQKKMDNPEFKNDTELFKVCNPCSHVGFELWQVKAGTIFDDIIITDDAAEADKFYADTFAKKQPAEKTAFDAAEAKKRAEEEAERKKAEAAAAAEAEKKKETKEDKEEDADEDEDDDEL